jgi:hypothetical protein
LSHRERARAEARRWDTHRLTEQYEALFQAVAGIAG